jgi:cardiolipin synthase
MTLRRQDLRQHRKLIAIDNKISYTGSMNLADPEFFKTKSGVGPWVDMMVRLEGDISKIVQGTLIFDWEMETGIRLEKYLDWPEFTAEETDNTLMQLLPSGPALDEEILLQVLLTAIHNATAKVVITTPYFVPDEALLQALKSAAKRGLSVTLIVPRKNDSKLAQFAGRSFYDELLTSGVTIQRFSGGLLHSKTVIIDDHLVLIGSVNLDMRSIWLNFEATLIVDNEKFCQAVLAIIDNYTAASQRLQMNEWKARPYHQRLLENVTQLASPLL